LGDFEFLARWPEFSFTMSDRATLEDAVENGIDLSSNAFILIHGWTCGALLLDFVASFAEPLSKRKMTPEEMCADLGAKAGPLAVMLRTCRILGYVEVDDTGAYSAVQGVELEELQLRLRPGIGTAKALRSVYTEAVPPFKVPSEAATHCLVVWAEHRPGWTNSKSKVLPVLLDGIVLAPLLTSITYFARWSEEGLDYGKDKAMDRFDFSKLDAASRTALGEIFEELGVGAMSPKGIVSLSTRGSLALQRCYSYYVPTSYSPLMGEFSHILFEEPGWGFEDLDEGEIHVERTLNVVGSGAQHATLFKDLMRHIDVIFSGEDYAGQPRYVVDTGSGDGHLLMQIYQHIKEHTPRGRVLEEFPVIMVGVDFNEEARVATAVNLTKSNITHMVLFGDIGKPKQIMAALQKKGVDLSKTLHVRSFLDHDRPYVAPKEKLSGEAAIDFARTAMQDCVHLDKAGERLSPEESFGALVEHFRRWSDALQDSFGLCLLEVMMLDVPTTKRFINDCVSFHFDIVQCLSRQYMTSATAFAMGAAMAGLVPGNVKSVQIYPEEGNYCRMINQHLVRRKYSIRFAEVADLPSLERLESLAWAEQLQASPSVLKTRLETSPTTNLVCEMDGKVVAVLYMQRIQSEDDVDKQKFMEISQTHDPAGRILQLVAIATDPEVSNMGIGSELRSFALHLARLDPTVDFVIGVTRCRDFKGGKGTMQQYVDDHKAGRIVDPIVDFHTSYGAEVVRIVPDFRPEDKENEGVGVLIKYGIKDLSKDTELVQVKAKVEIPSLEVLAQVMEELGYTLDRGDLHKGFYDYGMDSLELVRVRNRLSSSFHLNLPATLLLDFPTVKDLAEQLDRDRGLGDASETMSATSSAESEDEVEISGWEGVTPSELLELQERFKSTYKQPAYQKQFAELARKCYPDMMRYILAIEEILVQVEGPLLLEFGLIDALDWQTVQIGRSHMTATQIKYWKDYPEVKQTMDEILHITKQDQYWR